LNGRKWLGYIDILIGLEAIIIESSIEVKRDKWLREVLRNLELKESRSVLGEVQRYGIIIVVVKTESIIKRWHIL